MEGNKSEIRHPHEDLLIDYADDNLDPVDLSHVADHLETCSACRHRVKALQESLALTQTIWQDSLGQIEGIQIPVTKRFPWKWIQGVAAVILLGVGLFWASHSQTAPTEQIPSPSMLEQIARDIDQATMAAKLLAAADLMTKHPDARNLVQNHHTHPKRPGHHPHHHPPLPLHRIRKRLRSHAFRQLRKSSTRLVIKAPKGRRVCCAYHRGATEQHLAKPPMLIGGTSKINQRPTGANIANKTPQTINDIAATPKGYNMNSPG